MDKILLIGGGGHCKVIIDAINNCDEFEIAGVLDKETEIGKKVNGVSIIGTDDDMKILFEKGIKNAFISVGSVGSTELRNRIYNLLKNIGFNIPNIIHPKSCCSKDMRLGEGNYIGAGVIINPGTIIENNSIINTSVVLEHDCYIGGFSHIASGAVLSGNVTIGKNTHIGTNATLIQNTTIGNNCMIGAGSVVLKDISDNKKAYGVPCREV